MRTRIMLCCVAAIVATFAVADVADAGNKKHKGLKRTPQVAEFNRRVGGYSYDYNDAIIDYRDETILEGPNTYEPTGPLDRDTFFDSNVTSFGSDAPYMN